MNCYKYLILMFSSITILSCSSDNNDTDLEEPIDPIEPNSEIFFSLSVGSEFDTSETDNWIIIHNQNGELLDYRSYEQEQNLIFESETENLTDLLTITLFKYSVIESNGIYHNIESFTNIARGSEWIFDNSYTPSIQENSEIGSFDVTINGIIPDLINLSITNSDGIGSHGYSSSTSNGIT